MRITVNITALVIICILSSLGDFVDAQPTVSVSPVFPLRISENRSFLEDQDGKPFLIHGDSPWLLFISLTREEAIEYMDNRVAMGFNTLVTEILEHKDYSNIGGIPANRYGVQPFKEAGSFNSPDSAYFAHVAWVVEQAEKRGLLLIISYAWLGPPWEPEAGWFKEIYNSSPASSRKYGQTLGRFLQNYKNVIWITGGDSWPERNGSVIWSNIEEMIAGIKEYMPGALFTAHPQPNRSSFDGYDKNWLDINSTYTYSSPPSRLILDYKRSRGIMPSFLFESDYEGANPKVSVLKTRAQAYCGTLLSGCGQAWSNDPLWKFPADWRKYLDTEGTQAMKYMRGFFESVNWWNLVPDLENKVVTSDKGNSDMVLDYLAVAAFPDCSTIIAYTPKERQIEVDFSKCKKAKSFRCQWFNPRTGQYSEAGDHPAGQKIILKTPDNLDWILKAVAKF